MCYLNQHLAKRKNERKGGGASVQENGVKYLLCVQMQETHLIHTFGWLNWPCREPGQHLHSLSALSALQPHCVLLYASPMQEQEGLMCSQETQISLDFWETLSEIVVVLAWKRIVSSHPWTSASIVFPYIISISFPF